MPPALRIHLSVVLVALALLPLPLAGLPAHAQSGGSPTPHRDPEAGLPFITTFAPLDYEASVTNWAVVEDERGVVYVGNNDGVLEYDGGAWRLHQLPNGSHVRSLARDTDGRIWFGGWGDLGYLTTDGLGRTAIVSLWAEVPEPYRDNYVWSAAATARGVYFTSAAAVLQWDGERMAAWPAEGEFHVAAEANGSFYVREWGRGLLRMEPTAAGDSLRLVPGGERFAKTRIYAVLPFDEEPAGAEHDGQGPAGKSGRLLVGTREEGLFLYDGRRFEPFETEADGFLARGGLRSGTALPHGRFALGTLAAGLLVIDRRGHLLHRLYGEAGLPEVTVSDIDVGGGGLWLALGEGLAHVELDAPFSRYGAEQGVAGMPYALARHEGRLYAGYTSGGLAYLDPAPLDAPRATGELGNVGSGYARSGGATSAVFRPVENAQSYNVDFLSVGGDLSGGSPRRGDPSGGDLLVAGNDGVYRIRGDRAEPVRASDADDFYALSLHAWSRDPDLILVGLADGVAALERRTATSPPGTGPANPRRVEPGWVEPGWVETNRVPGVNADSKAIVEADDGALWVGLVGAPLTRLRLPEPDRGTTSDPSATSDPSGGGPVGGYDFDEVEAVPYGLERGLPAGVLPYRVGDEVYASAADERLFRYDEAADRFVEDPTFDAARSGHPLARLVLRESAGRSVWITSTYGAPVLATPRSGGEGGYTFERLHRLRRSRIRDVYPEDDGVAWLIGSGEIIRYDASAGSGSPPRRPPPPLIRRVTAGDSLLYGGGAMGGEDTGGSETTGPEVAHRNEIAYGTGAVRFAYAAPGGAAPVRYRTRLEGFDAGWSAWTAATERAYTNLPPGAYRFVVEAEERGQAAYALAVLPPWYRTWWAYVFFALGAVGAVVAVVGLRTRQLRHRQRKLDAEVAKRTRELRAEQRKTAEQAAHLEEQAERLREMDRLKSRFFANVSHEFRTPLTLTIGPLEDVEAEADLPAPVRRNVNLALRNSRRLLRLIGQLLDVAKLEAGELRLNACRGDLAAFVRGVARAFAPLAERRRVRFTVDAPEHPVVVVFDEEKLEQVLVNLLSNAFKFTPIGGAIHLAVAADGADAIVTVRDSGPGVDAGALPHLFERFYQADETRSEVQAGTGIGLSLAKDLAELHGGTIAVETPVGFGTIFTVRLPLAPVLPDTGSGSGPLHHGENADSSEAPARVTVGKRGEPTLPATLPDRSDGWSFAGRHGEVPSVGMVVDAGSRGRHAEGLGGEFDGDDRTTVLVADDNAEIRAYVRGHLEPHYRVLEAADGREALATARAALPDVVVSDVMMPYLDGFQLVRALRADRETDFIPVVLLTARAEEDDRVEGLHGGADAYLTKPFSVRELRAYVEALIASRQRLKARFTAEAPSSGTETKDVGALASGGEAYATRARAAVEARLSDDAFGVEDLAAALEQSRSTLHRRLRDAVDRTPTAFIREVRLERAAALLEEHEGTVSEVAYAVGFKSVSHFCQAFRNAYGTTPSTYADTAPKEA